MEGSIFHVASVCPSLSHPAALENTRFLGTTNGRFNISRGHSITFAVSSGFAGAIFSKLPTMWHFGRPCAIGKRIYLNQWSNSMHRNACDPVKKEENAAKEFSSESF
jgi:hypothetical protein